MSEASERRAQRGARYRCQPGFACAAGVSTRGRRFLPGSLWRHRLPPADRPAAFEASERRAERVARKIPVLDTVVTDDGVECVLCVPRGRARHRARAASSVRRVRAGQPCVRFTVASCAPQPLPPRASPPAACGCRRRMRRTGKRWGNQLSTKYAYVPLAGAPRNERKRPARTAAMLRPYLLPSPCLLLLATLLLGRQGDWRWLPG